ncbi:FkbM family methyltransferase [Nostocaceae cyanobacterium CENA369]|uniref:FkbM family methyltransferase n=1 Tax=Dendronalium phyllosphericum CENA369 TaxID=1725256 RepID=A0A8J7I8J8_9NOST|nr:FkbM family methyltransferase [Dendronalium phyllosphericum]MBH8575045.1 FkbM family methyltransferase [Dendronalium phyllosphericum CENA369]
MINISQLKNKADRFLQRTKITYYDWKKPQLVKINGITVPVIDNVPRELQEALYAGTYEKYELKIVESQLQQNDVVMELGTGIGLVSSFCAKKIGNNRVFTYEANPVLKPVIWNTYTLNNVSPNLEMCMLGENVGEQTFYIAKGFWESSIVPYQDGLQPINVPVKSFNEEVKKVNPSFLILDIEGGEYEFFHYANLHNIQKIAMELHKRIIGAEKANFVRSKLIASGFQLNEKISFRGRELFWEKHN